MSQKSSNFAATMAKNTEIERKFLVRSEAFKTQAVTSYEIVQGYLLSLIHI